MKNDHKVFKKICALLLSAALVFTYASATSLVYADDLAGQQDATQVVTEPADEMGETEAIASELPAAQTEPEAASLEEGDGVQEDEAAESTDVLDEAAADEAGAVTEEPQTEFSAGTLSYGGNGYEVALSYGADAKIPENAALQVKEIKGSFFGYSYNRYLKQTESALGQSVAYARFFDITIVDGEGNEIEPSADVNVSIQLDDLDASIVTMDNVELAAIHFTDANVTENVDAVYSAANGSVDFIADSFSTYGVAYSYTVDFYYTSAEGAVVSYSMEGGSTMQLSDLLAQLGIDEDAGNVKSITSEGYEGVTTPLEEKLSFTKEHLGGDWKIASMQPFEDWYYVTITMKDGTEYVISVTDPPGPGGQGEQATTSTTVDHIDIGIVAAASINIPLAYGNYYDADGNLILTADIGEYLKGTGVNESVDITEADLRNAEITASCSNASQTTTYTIDEYTNSSGSSGITQVRIGGTFYTGTLANPVNYTVTVEKSITLTMQYTIDGVTYDLYDDEGNPITVSVQAALSATFNYFDEDNDCPGIHSDNTTGYVDGGAGMDFILGTADDQDADLTAIEIVKYIVDEDGNPIETSEGYDFSFEVYQNTSGDLAAPADWSGATTAAVDYSGYTKLSDKELTTSTDGIGLVYDYSVADSALLYVKEGTPVSTITDADGNTLYYDSTYIETEYVWRDDNGETHSNVNQADTLTAIPEVVGDYYYIDADGNRISTWSDDEGTYPLHNTFLEFHVYNVYKPATTEVTVEKVWSDSDDQDGIRPESVEVTLTGSDGTTYTATLDGTADTEEPTTAAGYESAAWKATFVNLPISGADGNEITYTAGETTTAVITGTDGPGTYRYAVTGTQDNGFTVTNTHTPEVTTATITKAWDDADDQDGIRPDSVEVSLTGSDGTSYSVTLDGTADTEVPTAAAGYESAAWTATFVNLPKYADGTEITYTAEETTTTVITGTDGAGTYAYAVAGTLAGGFTVTNTHTPEVTTATITKVWDDADDQDGIRPDSVEVSVTGSDGTTYSVTLDGTADTEVPTTAAGYESAAWTATFVNLPKYADGTEITYTTYAETTTDVITGEDGVGTYAYSWDGSTVTNTHTPEVTTATITKAWDDADDQDGIRPDSIEVKLTGSDGTSYSVTLDGTADTEVPTTAAGYESAAWTATFVNLPKYADGTEITYTTYAETTTDVITGEDGVGTYAYSWDGSTVTNKHTPETIAITGVKKWEDEKYQDFEVETDYERPSITITLTGSDQKTYSVELNGTADTAPTGTAAAGYESAAWAYTFVNLPKYHEGTEIEYTVKEISVEGFSSEIDAYTVINTPKETKRVEDTAITIFKVDEATGNEVGLAGAVFTLTDAEGNETTYTTGEDGTVKIPFKSYSSDEDADVAETSTYTLKETTAPEGYELNETEYTITVKEKLVSVKKNKSGVWEWLYELIAGVSADFDEDTLTLTVENPPTTTQVTATKVWVDADDQDGKRPDSITYTLTGTADGEEVYSDTQKVAESDKWTYEWTELAAYYDGAEVTYEVTEAKVDGYTTEAGDMSPVTDEEGNVTGYAIEFTNSHTPAVTLVTVTKEWDDESDKDGIRPDSIEVVLYANGEAAGDPVVLSEDNAWSYTWEDLAVYESGEEIAYTVDEAAVPDQYTKVVGDMEGDADNGYEVTITNSYKPETPPETPKTGDDSSATLWMLICALSAVVAAGMLVVRKRRAE